MGDSPWQVVLPPGGVMPAGPAYGALLAELGPDVDARPNELEVMPERRPTARPLTGGWLVVPRLDAG